MRVPHQETDSTIGLCDPCERESIKGIGEVDMKNTIITKECKCKGCSRKTRDERGFCFQHIDMYKTPKQIERMNAVIKDCPRYSAAFCLGDPRLRRKCKTLTGCEYKV